MPIVLVGLSHRTCPVELRERLAFGEGTIPEALGKLKGAGLATEAVILSTCNRVELYASSPGDSQAALAGLRQFLLDTRGVREPLNSEIYTHSEPQSVEHLFRVACGLDSMVLGETEILGQMKKAYELAQRHQHTGKWLNKAFQRAFNVAKQVRTETSIQRGNISVGAVAVELAEKIFASLGEREVMVVGAGDTGEKTARALLSRGAKGIVVTNRSPERAQALAAELGGRAVPFEQWGQEFAHLDIIITSTAAPHYLIEPAGIAPLLRLRKHAPLLLIDIAVPRNIDPRVNELEDVYLYDIDDLQAIASDALRQRQQEIARCEGIIREKVQGLLAAPQGAPPGARPTAGA